MLVAARAATSCGGEVADQRLTKDSLGGAAGSAGATLHSGGGGGSGGLAIGVGGLDLLGAGGREGSSAGASGVQAVEFAWQCNDLRNDADTIILSYVSGEPPAARGGTPIEGLYHLTQLEQFTGIDGPSTGEAYDPQRTVALSWVGDGTARLETMEGQPDGEMGILHQWNETVVFDGNSFASVPTCRTESVLVSDSAGLYTATFDQLVFLKQIHGSGTRVSTYTLQ